MVISVENFDIFAVSAEKSLAIFLPNISYWGEILGLLSSGNFFILATWQKRFGKMGIRSNFARFMNGLQI